MNMGVRQRNLVAIETTPSAEGEEQQRTPRSPTASPHKRGGGVRQVSRSPRSSPPSQENSFAQPPMIARKFYWLLLSALFVAMILSSLFILNSIPTSWIPDNPPSPPLVRKVTTLRNGNVKLRPRSQKKRDYPPRIVYWDGASRGWTTTNTRGRKRRRTDMILYDEDEHNELSQHFVQDDWQPHHEHCLSKADWQTQSYPNCNSIHEIFIPTAAGAGAADSDDTTVSSVEETLAVLGEGWFRTTWRMDHHYNKNDDVSSDKESVVLKTLRIEREFLSEYYELHRRDAVAMERLTASPFVVDVYGYCGQSAINELANFPLAGITSLEGFNRRMRGTTSDKANGIKLRMAASIALGVADIHAAGSDDDDEDVYMVHYDLNPRNIALFAGGKPKINDFNIAEFLRYDPETNATCKFPSRLHEPWWRAPEEMNTTHKVMIDEKVDIYALGNILFHTLTTHSGRGKQKKERMAEVRPQVAAGIRPEMPDIYGNSTEPSIQAIVQAIDLCWEKDPEERASAEEVAAVLYEALLKIRESPAAAAMAAQQMAENNKDQAADDEEDDDEGDSLVEDKDALGHHEEEGAVVINE